MKIGILTLPLHTNYGGILQAYALQTVLQKMGHDVKVITYDYSAPIYPFYKVAYHFVRRLIGCLLKFRKTNFYNINKEAAYFASRHQAKCINVDKFIRHYINCHFCRSLSEGVHQNNYDAFVVGSDQIWRKLFIQGHFKLYDAYLDFAKNWQVKRIAYAASFGIDLWDYSEEETAIIKSLIRLFEAVSVREQSGVELCRKYLNVDPMHVVDPTLLLEKEQYEQIIEQSSDLIVRKSHILTHYILDQSNELERLVEKVANDKSLSPFSLDLYKSRENPLSPPPQVEQWLAAFRDAEFVITDSFHACVFSIIFHKPFIVIGNKQRGYARFLSLLQAFGLQRNLITSVKDYNPDADYSIPISTYSKLDEWRKLSFNFLEKYLS